MLLLISLERDGLVHISFELANERAIRLQILLMKVIWLCKFVGFDRGKVAFYENIDQENWGRKKTDKNTEKEKKTDKITEKRIGLKLSVLGIPSLWST